MIKLGIIGTNWISEKFVEAALSTGLFELYAVYSRKIETAKQFYSHWPAREYFDDIHLFANNSNIDAVYIASPNSLHCEQACLLMECAKHVICEKPLASNLQETLKMFALAQANNVVLFEAFKTEFLPNFIALKKDIASLGKLRRVHFNYCQYSSRFEKYLQGENPNTFNPAFSNGSIMDIGYYCVAAAVSLFGAPLNVRATAHLLDSGVDAHGTALLEYTDFDVVINHSKVCQGYAPSEILGEQGAIILPLFSECKEYQRHYHKGEYAQIALPQEENSMIYEAIHFAEQIKKGVISLHAQKNSTDISAILTEIRKQTGVVFPADLHSQ